MSFISQKGKRDSNCYNSAYISICRNLSASICCDESRCGCNWRKKTKKEEGKGFDLFFSLDIHRCLEFYRIIHEKKK